MDLLVLDSEFNTVAILDIYESFIWTDRYNEYGDFEAYFSPQSELLQHMVAGNYVWRRDSEHTMMIRKIEIQSDPETGPHAIVSGRSLEAILQNRVIAERTTLSGSLQNGIQTLLNQTIISPSNSSRRIPNFIFKASTDPEITKLTLEGQYFGENLYDVISDICYWEGIGFKVTLNASYQFVFELYKGVDRSYDQTANPYVVFSPRYENLVNSNYVYDIDNVRNVAYISGEEPEEDEETGVTPAQIVEMTGSGSGLERREIFVDGSNLRSTYRDDEGNEIQISDTDYRTQLQQHGSEELAEYYAEESFDGQVQGDYQWVLGEDYFMGDIIQIENEYGKTAKSRVIEMITAEDTSGIQFYPSFESVPLETV